MKKGFTVIELLLVVTILVLMASIVIPQLTVRSDAPGTKNNVDEYTIIESGEIDGTQYKYVQHPKMSWKIILESPEGIEDAVYTRYYSSKSGEISQHHQSGIAEHFNQWRVKILEKHGYLKPEEEDKLPPAKKTESVPDANAAGATET